MRIMTHYQKLLRVSTTGKSFHNITAKIEAIVAESGIETGLCSLFLRHTSASLVIQENADPDVLVDLANFIGITRQVISRAEHLRNNEYIRPLEKEASLKIRNWFENNNISYKDCYTISLS